MREMERDRERGGNRGIMITAPTIDRVFTVCHSMSAILFDPHTPVRWVLSLLLFH